MPIPKPTEPLEPCTTHDECLELFKANKDWAYYPSSGNMNIEGQSKFGWIENIARYRCCIQCKKPLDQAEADRINAELFNAPLVVNKEPESDDDFWKALNEF